MRYSSHTDDLISDRQAWESVTIPAEVTGYWLRGLKPNTRYYYALRNEATDGSSGRFTEILSAYSGEAKCKCRVKSRRRKLGRIIMSVNFNFLKMIMFDFSAVLLSKVLLL